LTPAGRAAVADELARCPRARVTRVLRALRVPASVWYHRPVAERKSPGPKRKPIPEEVRERIKQLARLYPWWGYQRIAVIARREGLRIGNKRVYQIFKEENLLQRPRVRAAEVYQTARLFELLPSRVNDLWQADVTFVHVPGHGWWYAVTVIDYYSRFLLACHFTPSYRAADVTAALDLAREEAERHHGPLVKSPFLVTDNGPSFLAKRFRRHIDGDYAHVRINYRTPTQLGLLERFHQTLKSEEVYWHLYQNPAEARERLAAFRERYNTIRPHWALRPEEGGDPLTPHDVYVSGSVTTLPAWQTWAKAARAKLDAMIAGAHTPQSATTPLAA
jgi:putative transposase